MKLSLIIEGLSSTLYRYVNIEEALETIKSNSFRMTNFLGSTTEFNVGKPKKYYFLSTARNKLGSYGVNPSVGGVMFVLDGRKLGQRYKGSPVDYWGSPERSSLSYQDEAEDRIYHDKPTIPTAIKYIKEVHVYLGEGHDGNIPDGVKRNLRELMKLMKQTDMSYWLYNNKRSWIVQNKKNAVEIDINSLSLTDLANTIENDKLKARTKARFSSIGKEIKAYEELYKTSRDKEDRLSKDAKDLKYRLKFDVNSYQDYVTDDLQNLLHNYKKDFSGITDKLIAIMKKEKLATPKQLVRFLKDKWDSPPPEEKKTQQKMSHEIIDDLRKILGGVVDDIYLGLISGNTSLQSVVLYINQAIKSGDYAGREKQAFKDLLAWAMDKTNWS